MPQRRVNFKLTATPAFWTKEQTKRNEDGDGEEAKRRQLAAHGPAVKQEEEESELSSESLMVFIPPPL